MHVQNNTLNNITIIIVNNINHTINRITIRLVMHALVLIPILIKLYN